MIEKDRTFLLETSIQLLYIKDRQQNGLERLLHNRQQYPVDPQKSPTIYRTALSVQDSSTVQYSTASHWYVTVIFRRPITDAGRTVSQFTLNSSCGRKFVHSQWSQSHTFLFVASPFD